MINANVKKGGSFLQRLRKEMRTHPALYLLMIPFVLYYILFDYVPMYGVIIAFQDYNVVKGIGGSDFGRIACHNRLAAHGRKTTLHAQQVAFLIINNRNHYSAPFVDGSWSAIRASTATAALNALVTALKLASRI